MKRIIIEIESSQTNKLTFLDICDIIEEGLKQYNATCKIAHVDSKQFKALNIQFKRN